jgi:hypothetical protein
VAGKEFDTSGIQEKSTNMTAIDKNELKVLLLKCWMTHEGMWFYHSINSGTFNGDTIVISYR